MDTPVVKASNIDRVLTVIIGGFIQIPRLPAGCSTNQVQPLVVCRNTFVVILLPPDSLKTGNQRRVRNV
jgi:hypothetical protein